MYIDNTKRIIETLVSYKRNFNLSLEVSQLEPKIDGAIISSLTFDLRRNESLFRDWVKQELSFSDEEYRASFFPLKQIHSTEFLSNPFLKNISIDHISSGNIQLYKDYFKQNEFVIYDEPLLSKQLINCYSLGNFDDNAYTYVLRDDKQVWMSINPMEMNTAYKAILDAHGKVLVLGGGLGYVPYMMSLKGNVESITIIESNHDIKKILESHILPQFKNSKVSIIGDDAFQYMDYISKNHIEYDMIFIDIWPDNIEGALNYKKFVKYENIFPNTLFHYWLEKSILNSYIINIYQYFNAKQGTEDYQKFFRTVAPDIWDYLEKDQSRIRRPDQLDYYLSKDFAKKMLKNL